MMVRGASKNRRRNKNSIKHDGKDDSSSTVEATTLARHWAYYRGRNNDD